MGQSLVTSNMNGVEGEVRKEGRKEEGEIEVNWRADCAHVF